MYRKSSGVLERVTYSYFIPFVANSAAIVLADSCIPLPIHSSIHPKVVKHKRQGVKFEKSCAVRAPPTLAKPWQLGGYRHKIRIKSGNDAERHSHRKTILRAQRRSEASHKAFLLPFFSKKGSGSDAERHSHRKSIYGRRGETQFRTKLF